MASEAARSSESPRADGRKLEHQFDLIRSAVALLANGGARRVTLVGMPLDEEALREADLLVQASGMLLRAADAEAGFDVTIEARR